MDIFQIDDDGRLFISPAIEEWKAVDAYGIDVVIDLEGGLDECIPAVPNACLYIYYPIYDDDQELPNIIKLRAIARMAASLIREGHRVLSHCGMGFNRCALMAGLILVELGIPGPAAVVRLRDRRRGALYNDLFAMFLDSLGSNGGAIMTDVDLVVVRTFLNRFEADVAKSALDAADIRSLVRADDAGTMNPGLSMGSPVQLLVRGEDADRAAEVLDARVTNS